METKRVALQREGKTARQFVLEAALKLAWAGVETSRLDAEVLLAHALGMTREQLVAASNPSLSDTDIRRCGEFLSRRVAREPLAYITGQQEFWSLEFHVNRDVLIPRPETERLVEITLDVARQWPKDETVRVLDMGTGSGAIAVSLAKELPNAVIWAADISAAALKEARANARRHGVAERMHFLQGDLFAPVSEFSGGFDLIVSNPPYVRRAEIDALQPEVSRWEPRGALDGGADGLDFYRRVAAQAYVYLAQRGALALEIGADMGGEVARLLSGTRHYRDVRVVQDYAGRDRVVVARTQTDCV